MIRRNFSSSSAPKSSVRVIFDENVPLPLRASLIHHEVSSVQEEGWSGTNNGRLLDLMEGAFDVFVLADKNLRHQHDLSDREIALVELPTNRWPLLQPLIPDIVIAVDSAEPGSYTIVGR